MAITFPHVRTRVAQARSLPMLAAAAAIVAAMLNAVVYGVARVAGEMPHTVTVSGPTGEGPVTLGAVVVTSILACAVAALARVALRKLTAHPARWFWIAGLGVLVLSLPAPFGIAGAPGGMSLALAAMHVITALSALVLLGAGKLDLAR
jgi:hypothetical protein